MKSLKKSLYTIILIISLFIINNQVFAFESDYILTEDDVNYIITKYNIDLEIDSNIFCYLSDGRMDCYFLNDDVLSNTIISKTYSGYSIKNEIDTSLTRYTFKSLESILPYTDTYINYNIWGTQSIFTNSDKIYDSITYDKIYKLNISSEEEITEPEINIKATKLLNFIIDKSKNIYEVLINNEIFKLILCIPLIYLCFIVIYKLISNRR